MSRNTKAHSAGDKAAKPTVVVIKETLYLIEKDRQRGTSIRSAVTRLTVDLQRTYELLS